MYADTAIGSSFSANRRKMPMSFTATWAEKVSVPFLSAQSFDLVCPILMMYDKYPKKETWKYIDSINFTANSVLVSLDENYRSYMRHLFLRNVLFLCYWTIIGLIWDIFFKEMFCSFVIEQSLFMSLTTEKEPWWSRSYGSWIYNYLCNQCLSSLTLWFRIPPRLCVLETCFTVHNTMHIDCHMYNISSINDSLKHHFIIR